MNGRSGQLDGHFLTPAGWQQGRLAWDDEGVIAEVAAKASAGPGPGEPGIVAGFVDLHVHGGGGADAMEGEAAVRQMARFHAGHGTVAMAPTTMTAAPEEIGAALAGIEAARKAGQAGEAQVVGAHLEGPFISSRRLGAQPGDFVIAYDPQLLDEWLAAARLRVATVAPEIDGGLELVGRLHAAGCLVQIGHSDATAQVCGQALAAGAGGFTHLHNAMSPLDHREPGVVACALAQGEHAELICDMEHVDPVAVLATLRAVPSAYAVTDATAAAGMPDGEHRLGSQPIVKHGCTVRTTAGVLAGSAMTQWESRRKLIGIGIPEQTAQAMVSSRPASYAGLDDLGEIAAGKAASLVGIVDDQIQQVWLRGRLLD